METAGKFVDVRKAKSGKFTGIILLDDGKKMSVPPGVELASDWNNKECLVIRDNGAIVQIICAGKELVKKTSNFIPIQKPDQSNMALKMQSEHKPNHTPNNSSVADQSAKAPYNFVPLNETLVEGEKLVDFSTYDQTRQTGYIQCELETLTPLYIRDTLDEDEVANNLDDNKNPDFFSPGGRCRIPGSSLRGMTRNLIEIMGWGKIRCMGERKLFYRTVGDSSSLGEQYRNIMLNEADGCFPKIKAGILKQNAAGKYEIFPSKIIKNTQIYRVNYDYRFRKIKDTNIALKEFEFCEIYFKPVTPEFHQHQKRKLKYAKVENISEISREDFEKGYLISSGDFGNKKHMHWIINIPAADVPKISIDQKVITDYKNDISRDEKSDLLVMLEKHKEGVPCFYITDDSGNLSFLGSTGMFRLGYSKTIEEHIPKQLRDQNNADISETIFGMVSDFASRVFFEDAKLVNGQNEIYMEKQVPQILSTPKPTTIQHYLEQKSDYLDNWNSASNIRGYKLYWHRLNSKWIEDKPLRHNDSQHTVIRPVKPGIKFTCKIRFENLTETELGALLFALDLPENHHHKLGMGKPLGLGTIKITPTLYLSDRTQRYSRLFDGDQWQLAEKKAEIQKYKDAFEHYVLERISPKERNGADSLWAVKRMQQLEAMLDWQVAGRGGWVEETRYMEIEHSLNGNEYKKRPILARPIEYRRQFMK